MIVVHEIFTAKDSYLDIIQISSDHENGRNYYTLATIGMSEHKMNIRKEFKLDNLDRAELVMFLHPDWEFSVALSLSDRYEETDIEIN